jgi:CHASE2 domain-containing sensor protein
MRRPDCEVECLLLPDAIAIELHYRQDEPDSATRISVGPPDRVAVTSVENVAENDGFLRLQETDLTAEYMFSVPDDAFLARNTHEYGEVLRADDAQRRTWFKNRVVLLADLRSTSGDWHKHPDGRTLAGAHAHAVPIEDILARLNEPRRAPSTHFERVDSAASVVLGIGLSSMLCFRRRLRMALIAAASLLAVCGSLYLASSKQIAWNPIVALAALAVALEASAPLWRLARESKHQTRR